jgi:hypothetical protein
MRASLILILLLLFQHICLQSQDFKLIVPGQEKQYYRDGDRIYSPNIKSIEQKDSHVNIWFDEIALISDWSNCYSNRYHDIFGSAISSFESGHNGVAIFGTHPIPVFQIWSHAVVGESWMYIDDNNGFKDYATCKSIQPELVNGQMELVKTIEFGSDCALKISQHRGIISTPTWNRLDLHWWDLNLFDDDQVECVERILDETILDKFNIPFGEIASDLQPGDELHIEESYSLPSAEESRKLIKAKFLEKSFDTLNNSYHLSFRQEVDEWKNIDGQITQSTYIDTAVSIIGRHLLLDSRELEYPVPLRRILEVGEKSEFLRYAFFNDKLKLDMAQLDLDSSVVDRSCFPFIYDIDEGYQFIEGLAGPYFKHYSVYPNERTLKYYKKGTEEWGEPFTFTVSTSEKIISESVSIFPNPVAAGSQIFLQDLGGKEMLEIRLVDLHGKQVQSWQLKNTTNQESLQLQKTIPPGLYAIWIKDNKQHQYYSKLVIK